MPWTLRDLARNRNDAILRSNGASTKLLGAPASAIEGSGLFTRILVGDRPAYLKAVGDAARGSATAVAQFRVKREDDNDGHELIWVEMRVHGVRLSDDLTCAAIAVTRDISAHRRYAEERDALRRDAVNANDARLNSCHREPRVAHPVECHHRLCRNFDGTRQPGSARTPRELRRDHSSIRRAHARRRQHAPRSLRHRGGTLQGSHSNRLRYRPLSTIAARSSHCEPNRRHRAEHRSAGRIPEIIADRRACRQMLLNLLSNAVKFTPRGGAIRVEVQRQGDAVSISVHDTGIGVEEEDLALLGMRFYRGRGRSRPRKREADSVFRWCAGWSRCIAAASASALLPVTEQWCGSRCPSMVSGTTQRLLKPRHRPQLSPWRLHPI